MADLTTCERCGKNPWLATDDGHECRMTRAGAIYCEACFPGDFDPDAPMTDDERIALHADARAWQRGQLVSPIVHPSFPALAAWIQWEAGR